MTLVIAGYNHSKSLDYSSFASDTTEVYEPVMEVNGLFVMADSAITSHAGGRTLLNGFRKIHTLEAKLWKPYFQPDGSFKDYQEVYETNELFVAFAGSTLTAQHIINSIHGHLGQLRISYERASLSSSVEYKVIRHCQKNLLVSDYGSYWDDDTFTNRDFEGLLTADVIANVIEYSVNDALRSASSYKLSMEEFRDMHTEIVAGIWCPVSKKHNLYVYRMQSRPGDDGVLTAFTSKELIPSGSIAVLGMRRTFESRAQEAFETAIGKFITPDRTLWAFLNDAIDEVQASESKEIDRPAALRTLERGRVRRVY